MRSPTNSAQASGPRATRAHWLLAPLLTLVISGVQAQTPEPADRDFAAGFPMLTDSEHALPLGGFGGTHRGDPPGHVPVIFVHGNTGDACNWRLVADDFRAAGWSDQALWALSYNGRGAGLGTAKSRPDPRCEVTGVPAMTSNDINVSDLYAFIEAVRDYTGSRLFSLVGHSLGVTVARKTLKDHPQLRDDLVAFVGIAGGNDGTSLCPPGSEKIVKACAEIGANTPWLEALNGPDGRDETYGPAQWLTIYDGAGEADKAFLGHDFAQSPALAGAYNRQFPGTEHNDLRVREDIVATYRRFLEAAETRRCDEGCD